MQITYLVSGIKFAKGSDGVPQNTLGIVNDQAGSTYKELIIPPSGKPFIPDGRNVMLPLEKGTKIMPANQTKAFMSGTPHFKGGIGEFFENAWSSVKSFTGNVLDYLTNPGEIVKVAISKFANISNLFEPWASVAGGIINKTFDGIVQYVSGIFDSIQPKYNPLQIRDVQGMDIRLLKRKSAYFGRHFSLFKNRRLNMALSSFLNVNGYDFPPPRRGFSWTITTTVNGGRNGNNAVIGQRVGRDLYKLSDLEWVGLNPETRKMMLDAIKPFYVPVTFEDMANPGHPITIIMYPGDRSGKPLFVDRLTHMVTKDETLSFNLIDAGLE